MAARRRARICFDRVLEGAQLQRAIEMAFSERLDNPPIQSTGAPVDRPPTPLELALLSRNLWKPGRSLHVRFMEGVDVVQQKVADIAVEWEQYANIKLVFDDSANAEIRIAFDPDDGSWSYLGTDALAIPQGDHTMNYGWLRPNTSTAEYRRVVLHEFGHALGCIHEHQNPAANIPWNREKVYKTYGGPPNNWTRSQVDVNLFQKYGADRTQFSAFDRNSIMLYPVSKDLTDGVFEVGWNTELSDVDKEFIAAMYPPAQPEPIQIVVDAEPLPAEIGAHGEEDTFQFKAATPGVYTIETGGRSDVLMGLFGSGDPSKALASDDDSGVGLNARIVRDLPAGSYTLRIRHYRPTGKGKYTVSVRRSG